jgi:phage terminase small subunit
MLTAKRQRFVEEYLIDLNSKQAAIRAGYSEKTAEQIGYQLIQKTSVLDAIKDAQAKLSEACLVSQKMVIEGLLTEAKLNGEGSSHSARVSAWGLLGKHLGMFVDKVDLNAKIKEVPKLEIVLTK